ncbi:MAG: hypothetical protein KDA99_26060 [Planctomycetales bacterium]|nr:hypothetical protein [Planctomycetales bacterium]
MMLTTQCRQHNLCSGPARWLQHLTGPNRNPDRGGSRHGCSAAYHTPFFHAQYSRGGSRGYDDWRTGHRGGGDPETAVDRAERLWHAFSDAMDEVAEGTDGWVILGAGNRFAHPWVRGGKFLNMRLTTYTNDAETEARIGKPFYIERYQDLSFGESRHDTY